MSQFIEEIGDPRTNPKNWPIKKLSELSTYTIGLTYKPEDVSEDGIIVLRSGNIQESKLTLTDTVRVNCQIKESLYVKEDDILMCSRNGSAALVGKVAQIKSVNEPMTYGAFMTIIRSEYSDYLFLYFQSNAFREQVSTGKSSTMNQITQKMLDKICLPFPDEDTRKRLSAILHQADKSEFDGLKSQFIEMIGSKDWPQMKLKDIVHEDCPISYGIVQPGDDLEDGVPIVRPIDMNETHLIDKNTLKHTSKEISDSYSRTILRGDEILVCVRGTTGLIALADGLKGCNVTRGITPLYFKPQFSRDYLFRAFLGQQVQDYIQDNTIGSTLKGINMSKLRELPICMPPEDVQEQFVTIAHQADKSESAQELLRNINYN